MNAGVEKRPHPYVLFGKFLVTFGLLGWLATTIDWAGTATQIRQSNVGAVLVGTLILGTLPLISAWRWRLILQSLGVSPDPVQIGRWTYISLFYSQLLPATVGGDAMRILLVRHGGCPGKTAISSVGIDRVCILLCLLLMIVASSPALGAVLRPDELTFIVTLLAGGTLLGAATVLLARHLPPAVQRLRIVQTVHFLFHDAGTLFTNPRASAITLSLCVLTHAVIVGSVYFFAVGFGADVEPKAFVALVLPVLLVSALPISIGGWGTREAAMVAALGMIGVSSKTALLVSVWLGIASILITLPGAVFGLSALAWRQTKGKRAAS